MKIRHILYGLCLLITSFSLSAQPLAPQSIPEQLKPWVPWVLHEYPNHECPYFFDRPQQQCTWASELALNVQDHGASFIQRWQVAARACVALPADKSLWPQQVQQHNLSSGEKTAAILSQKDGLPCVWLEAGDYQLSGQWLWQKRPEYLSVSPAVALIQLKINQQDIAQPVLDNQGRLWLNRDDANNKQAAEDNLTLRVYRHLVDDMPLQMGIRLELDVAGRAREIHLPPLWQNNADNQWQALSLDSPLPARLEQDARLRLQVRPGTWEISIAARHLGKAEKIVPSLLTENEIWVFQARHDLRQVYLSGLTDIDPQQTGLPESWKAYPSYLVEAGQVLSFEEKRRGNPEPAPDQLSLERQIWLDFDGQGYTLQDRIKGTMSQGWRLNMNPPIQLGRVHVNGEDRFITELDAQGVEIRQGNFKLLADSRIDTPLRSLPAIGWQHDFQSLSATLNLPPGWHLLHASGVDNIPSTWLNQWQLLDIFIVLITALAIAKLWHWRWGALALVSLVLTYHVANAPQYWLLLLAPLALLRVLPPQTWFTRLVRSYLYVTLLVLLVNSLLFIVQQVKSGLYPQLAPHHSYSQILSYTNTRHSVAFETNYAEEEMDDGFADTEMLLQQDMKQLYSAPSKASRLKRKYKSMKKQQALLRADPNAQVQTGPGLPNWSWQGVNMYWDGGVPQSQQIKLYLLSPPLSRLLAFAQALFLASLLGFLIWQSVRLKTPPLPKAKQAMPAMLALFCLMGLMQTPMVEAKQTPEPQTPSLLDTLEQRLTQPPECLPHCASITDMHLQADAKQLRIRLQVHANIDTQIPLPAQVKHWLPQQVLVNDKTAEALMRDSQGKLWLRIDKGIHQVSLEGVWPVRSNVQLPLPLQPHHVSTEIQDWRLDGLQDDGSTEAQLQFTRLQSLAEQSSLEMGALPPLLQITRILRLNLDWQIETRVKRQSPRGSAVVMDIPLLEGESVISAEPRVVDGKIKLNMPPNAREVSWLSSFKVRDSIKLTAPATHDWYETWQLDSSPIWHVQIQGIPVIHHQDSAGSWLPTWRPWPGEQVQIDISRPKGVQGQIMTIDNSKLTVKPGQRLTNTVLEMTLRSSRGGQHMIELPKEATLQKLWLDGDSQALRQNDNRVPIALRPGEQKVKLEFSQDIGISSYYQTPSVNLGSHSVNANIVLELPKTRWLLFVGGPALGPAVLFWGMVIVLLALSFLLARLPLTPLRWYQWFLLGLIVSQLHIWANVIVFGWLLVLGWRAQLDDNMSKWRFDMLQIALALLTFSALWILFAAIEHGLLRYPEMYINGNGSYGYWLHWYQDRQAALLPQAWVVSIPLWVYRLLMLAWALWLAFALLKWLPWAWQSYSHNRLWMRLRKLKK